MKTKHILYFPTWTKLSKINESEHSIPDIEKFFNNRKFVESKEAYDQVKQLVTGSTSHFVNLIKTDKLTTKDIMSWLVPLVNLCKQEVYPIYVYNNIKTTLHEYRDELRSFFGSKNPDKNLLDLEAITYFKESAKENEAYLNNAEKLTQEVLSAIHK